MKSFFFLIPLLLFLADSPAQTIWTPPARITSGHSEDLTPTFATTQNLFGRKQEMLAFVRRYPLIDVSGICVMKTSSDGSSWIDSVITIIEDSLGGNDQPTLAEIPSGPDTVESMLLWHRWTGANNIFYAYDSGKGWIAPRSLTQDSLDNRAPRVAPFSNGFGAVWQRSGTIAYAEFRAGRWSEAGIVSLHADSSNFAPDLRYLQYFAQGREHPMIVWEKANPPDTLHAILYTIRTDSGWIGPDTITAVGDNRNPRFFKNDFQGRFSICWESNRSGRWELYAAAGDEDNGMVGWEVRDQPLTSFSSSDRREGSFMIVPLILSAASPRSSGYFPYFGAGAWHISSGGRDTIAAATFVPSPQLFTVDTLSSHPDISCGVTAQSGLRVWCAWQAGPASQSKIFSTWADIVLSAPIEPNRPRAFELMQNYPNPFNPKTSITFRIPQAEFVRLRVFNLVGEEIETLVNGKLSAGSHTVAWSATGRPSGIYFYRLETHEGSQVRAMTLLR